LSGNARLAAASGLLLVLLLAADGVTILLVLRQAA